MGWLRVVKGLPAVRRTKLVVLVCVLILLTIWALVSPYGVLNSIRLHFSAPLKFRENQARTRSLGLMSCSVCGRPTEGPFTYYDSGTDLVVPKRFCSACAPESYAHEPGPPTYLGAFLYSALVLGLGGSSLLFILLAIHIAATAPINGSYPESNCSFIVFAFITIALVFMALVVVSALAGMENMAKLSDWRTDL